MGKRLTSDQVERYHRDGFLSPIDLLTEHEAAQLRAALEAAEARWPAAFVGAGRNNAHLTLTCLDRIVHHPDLLDAVEDLIGPDILTYGTILFIKEPSDPGYVSWHQDARYIGLDPMVGVSAWVALSDSSETTGCMQMVPGSHHALRAHDDTFATENLLTRGQQASDIDPTTAVATPLRPGQVSFHSPLTVHGSQPNRGTDRRIGLAIQPYIPPTVRQTITPTAAQLARGTDRHSHFEIVGRPTTDMHSDDVATRNRINDTWTEILYHGARARRDL